MAVGRSATYFLVICIVALTAIFSCAVAAQTSVTSHQPKPVPKTLFYDHTGQVISNNEFVDIRMANFHHRDNTVVKTLADGTVEFWLQKVPQESTQAPNFSAKTLDGESVSSADLKGKVVVLNFWFIGCGVCRAIKPNLNELATKFADNDNVVFIAMTADPASQVIAYNKNVPSKYTHIADAENTLDKFSFSGYPKNIVISASGEIVYWRSSVTAWAKFESVISNELNKIEK